MPLDLPADIPLDFGEPSERNPEAGGAPIGTYLTDTQGDPVGQILDYSAEGNDRLIEEYKKKPFIEALNSAVLDELTELEKVFWDLYVLRSLDTAEGVQLDGLGDIVGEPRGNKDEETYRRFIRIRVLVNNSDGKIEQLYSILRGLLGEGFIADIQDSFPAGIVVYVGSPLDPLTPEDVNRLLRKAKGGGIRLDFVYSDLDETDMFLWSDDDDTPDTGGFHGWGDSLDLSYGGAYANAYSE
jgi:hypothetical protein